MLLLIELKFSLENCFVGSAYRYIISRKYALVKQMILSKQKSPKLPFKKKAVSCRMFG